MGDMALTGKITLGRYMWERLHQIGIDTLFGVPGDFNLQFLDAIYHVDGLSWMGCQNELNAAYAADGYSRIKGVPGCVVTTHGVGELSALNGIAGSMSEHVKVIHVVGQTTRPMQDEHMMIHHSIGPKPDHQQYNKASVPLRFAAAELWDVKTAPAEIDRVIRECFIKSGPVYIFLPLDLSAEEVDASLLQKPIDVQPAIDQAAQEAAVKAITSALSEAKNPALLVDALAHRFGAVQETRQLVKKLSVLTFSANMGKGIVHETEPTYVGVWNGEVSHPGVKEAAKAADLVVTVGYIPADTNSAAFSRPLDDQRTIHINPYNVVVKGQIFPNTYIKPLLASLIAALPSTPQHTVSVPTLPPPRIPLDKDATHITQSWLWPQIEAFLRPGDIVVSETGTSNFGIVDIKFPENVSLVTQIYYGSIGFAFAATLGVEVARREQAAAQQAKSSSSSSTEEALSFPSQGRTILCTGDGSMALTIQEIGTMIKAGLAPIIFVINNEGYTIERSIWGAKQPYNDVVATNYTHLLPLYYHPSPSTSFHRATTKTDLTPVLAHLSAGTELKRTETSSSPKYLQLVELVMHKLDLSWRLGGVLAWRSADHAAWLEEEGFVDTYGGWGIEGAERGSVKWS